jgi:hypothetical protein
VDFIRANPDLGAKTVSHSVSHPGASIPEDTSAVDPIQETLSSVLGRRYNGFGVFRRVRVYVFNRKVDAAT